MQPLHSSILATLGLSFVGAIALIRPHASVTRRAALRAAAGCACYIPLLAVYWAVYLGVDRSSPSPLLAPGDQEIAVHQWCPIELQIESIIHDVRRANIRTDDALTGLSECIFRLGQMMGVIDSHDVANHSMWRALTLDLVRSATDTIIDLRG